MKKLIKISITSTIAIPLTIILLGLSYYAIDSLNKSQNRTHVKDEFYIEYLESTYSISLRNDGQVFVREVKEAYWNQHFLTVRGNEGCFLIEFGKTEYPEDMTSISCDDIEDRLVKPFKTYKQNNS